MRSCNFEVHIVSYKKSLPLVKTVTFVLKFVCRFYSKLNQNTFTKYFGYLIAGFNIFLKNKQQCQKFCSDCHDQIRLILYYI